MKKIKHLKFGKSALLIIVSTLTVCGLILGSWGTVYAAENSLPGDPLYAVKLTKEDLQLALTSDSQAKIELLTTFADHRAEEAATLASQGQAVPDELQTLVNEYLIELTVLTATMDEATQQEVLEGVQRHLRPRDQDQGMTNPKDNTENPMPDNMYKNGKGQDSGDSTLEVLAIDVTSEISVTQTITPGMYGPGPCMTSDCTAPLADEHSPGAYWGTAPGPENYEGYGPGYEQGQGYLQDAPVVTNNGSSNAQGQNGQP